VLFDQRALLLRRSYTEVGGDRLPKGQRVHSVPMAPQVYDVLLRLAPDELDPDGRVFPGEKAGAMDASALYRRYVKAQQRAGVRRLRFHDLRHTFGTQAIASGAHVMDVKDWMGHRHLSTTMRYVHHQPRHEAAERLGRHFSGAAAELDALLGDPSGVRLGVSEASKLPAVDDSTRLESNAEDASSG
jgi:integrase